jgi:diaminopimelate decarboxylase
MITDYKTPCFLLDEKEFDKNEKLFKKALSRYFSNNIIGFSVKTNSFPYLLNIAKKAGCYAEVVSYTEYNLALLCGFKKNNIIYNGPMKSEETFVDAIENGAIVNIETKREIEWLKKLDSTKEYQVGIRLNVNISMISPDDAKHDDDDSRFGFSAENNEFEDAINDICSIGHVKLTGVHIHRTSKTRSVDFYRHLVRYGISVIKKYHLEINYLDVGGGYFGIFGNEPSYDDYVCAIAEEFTDLLNKNILIIVEPGNALTASVFHYKSSVIDVKKVGGKTFITTDATRNDIDPLFQKSDYIKKVNYQDKVDNSLVDSQLICGCTCLEFDRLFELKNSRAIKVGDVIDYYNVGAYTMCLSPLFIRYIPRVYSLKTGKIIREEWTEKEYVNKCVL